VDRFDRLIAGASIIFHSLPTLAIMFEPWPYWMVAPAGAFFLLFLPWSPTLLGFTISFSIPLSLPLRSLGTCLLLGGTGIFIASLTQLLRGRGLLVSSGLYSLVRHPQYLGITLATLGLTFMGERLNLVSVKSWVTLVFAYVFLAYREERILQKRFGSVVRTYERRVSFMLPLFASREARTFVTIARIETTHSSLDPNKWNCGYLLVYIIFLRVFKGLGLK